MTSPGALDALSILFRDSSPRRFDEAEAACRESVAIRQKLYGDDHPDLASSYCYLAVLGVKNNLAEAQTCYRKALWMKRKSKGQTWWYASSVRIGAPLLQKEGKLDEAETCWRRDAVSIARKQMGEDNPLLGEGMLQLAQLLRNSRIRRHAQTYPRMPWPCIDAFQAVRFQLSGGSPDFADILDQSGVLPLPNQWPVDLWKSAKRIFPTIGVLSIPAICWAPPSWARKKIRRRRAALTFWLRRSETPQNHDFPRRQSSLKRGHPALGEAVRSYRQGRQSRSVERKAGGV